MKAFLVKSTNPLLNEIVVIAYRLIDVPEIYEQHYKYLSQNILSIEPIGNPHEVITDLRQPETAREDVSKLALKGNQEKNK